MAGVGPQTPTIRRVNRSRTLLAIYLAIVHLAILAVIFLYKDAVGLWFFAIEAVLLVSWFFGLWMLRRATASAMLLESFSALLEESEFTTRLLPMGNIEADAVIGVYNKMLDALHREYLRIGERRGFFDQFLQTAPVGVLILDFDQAVSVVNPWVCGMLRLPRDQIQGKRLSQIDHPLMHELRQMESDSARVVGHAGTGRVRIQKSEFLDRGFQRSFFIFEELTQVLATSEKKAYEKLIRTMSHEVNNTVAGTSSLLQSCLNFADQLNAQDEVDYRTALDVAIGRNLRLNEFMKAYADLVKLPAPVKRPADLVVVLDQLAIMFSAESKRRSIDWVKDYGNNPVEAMIDVTLFEQALINICRNALDAVGEKGTVTLSISQEDGKEKSPTVTGGRHYQPSQPRICLRIIDSADGLNGAVIGQLFSPFYTTRKTGQGIGLTLVKEILGGHGFTYDLRRRPDARTEFVIWITRESGIVNSSNN